jgi:hypothetical protein
MFVEVRSHEFGSVKWLMTHMPKTGNNADIQFSVRGGYKIGTGPRKRSPRVSHALHAEVHDAGSGRNGRGADSPTSDATLTKVRDLLIRKSFSRADRIERTGFSCIPNEAKHQEWPAKRSGLDTSERSELSMVRCCKSFLPIFL